MTQLGLWFWWIFCHQKTHRKLKPRFIILWAILTSVFLAVHRTSSQFHLLPFGQLEIVTSVSVSSIDNTVLIISVIPLRCLVVWKDGWRSFRCSSRGEGIYPSGSVWAWSWECCSSDCYVHFKAKCLKGMQRLPLCSLYCGLLEFWSPDAQALVAEAQNSYSSFHELNPSFHPSS